MRHCLILSHPNPRSFDAAIAKAYVLAVEAMGIEAEVRDLYALGFDPRLQAHELPWTPDFAPGGDVVGERALLAAADVFVFVYPLWFNAPPAMLKGYVERVFGMGFGYEAAAPGTRPLLKGRSLVTISTSGAPDIWIQQTGAVERLRRDFDEHLGAVCGLAVLEHLNFGGVTPGMREDAGEALLDQVRDLAQRLFGRRAAPAGEAP